MSRYNDIAISLQAQYRYEDAAGEYERKMDARIAVASEIIDLIVLYWVCTDYGMSTSPGISRQMRGIAGERFPQLIKYHRETFGLTPQLDFWINYINWCDGLDFSNEYCRSLISDKYIEPCIFLFSTSHGADMKSLAEELYMSCVKIPTARSQYIISVYESVVNAKFTNNPILDRN